MRDDEKNEFPYQVSQLPDMDYKVKFGSFPPTTIQGTFPARALPMNGCRPRDSTQKCAADELHLEEQRMRTGLRCPRPQKRAKGRTACTTLQNPNWIGKKDCLLQFAPAAKSILVRLCQG